MISEPSDKPWAPQAACKWTPPGFMFPETPGPQMVQALALCNGSKEDGTRPCPVRMECLAYAMRTKQEYGIWGGTTETDRRNYKRHRRTTLAPSG